MQVSVVGDCLIKWQFILGRIEQRDFDMILPGVPAGLKHHTIFDSIAIEICRQRHTIIFSYETIKLRLPTTFIMALSCEEFKINDFP